MISTSEERKKSSLFQSQAAGQESSITVLIAPHWCLPEQKVDTKDSDLSEKKKKKKHRAKLGCLSHTWGEIKPEFLECS